MSPEGKPVFGPKNSGEYVSEESTALLHHVFMMRPISVEENIYAKT